MLPLFFWQNIDSRLTVSPRPSVILQCQRHPVFYPMSGLPPKPDPFQEIDLGLKFPFLVLISQTIDSRPKKCIKLRQTSENSSLTIIIPEYNVAFPPVASGTHSIGAGSAYLGEPCANGVAPQERVPHICHDLSGSRRQDNGAETRGDHRARW